MKLWIVLTVVFVLSGCAAAPPSAMPPLSPLSCAGEHVRSAEDLAAFQGCTHVRGDLSISATGVVDLRALASLRNVEGTLGIYGCRDLESFAGLGRLQHVDHLVVVDNPSLARLDGLRALRSATGVSVVQNPRLPDLRGLEQLVRLEGLMLASNGLVSLRGLERLESVGDLVISDHPRLVDVSALSDLRHANNLTLQKNPAIAARLGFFEGLEQVTGSVVVSANRGLSAREARRLKERLSRTPGPRYSRR